MTDNKNISDKDRPDEWWDVLTGRSVDASDIEKNADARALRESILDSVKEDDLESSSDEELQRLLFRMRKEGLLESGLTKHRKTIALSLVASVLLAFVSIQLIFSPSNTNDMAIQVLLNEDYMVMRDISEGQVRTVSDPEAYAAALKTVLESNGLSVNVTKTELEIVVVSKINEGANKDLIKLLSDIQLFVPENGVLVLKIRK
ncbi:MAG: hypothetical protein DIZ80_08150 [endosymbiont of Galathealinum brachiosum]|uniref:Uncharacterized protein n=1 Tax=endosymbiont of Galathealinum brachiosum TaxID=2200906 RepID=A0A370DIA5_9GAMM|nr:MAG: hypothetical protein DIZ80_08150 [endosymbiont of Galathealinum brachiosum]